MHDLVNVCDEFTAFIVQEFVNLIDVESMLKFSGFQEGYGLSDDEVKRAAEIFKKGTIEVLFNE